MIIMDISTDIILDTSMVHIAYMVINVLIMLTEEIINIIIKAIRLDLAKATMMDTKAKPFFDIFRLPAVYVTSIF